MAEATQSYLREGSPAMVELERIVDQAGLRETLFALEQICFAKASHLEEAWHDPKSANVWNRYGRLCGISACKVSATLIEARRLARAEVREHLKRQGRKVQHYSARDLTEMADHYFLHHREEILRKACANLETLAQKPKPSNQRGVSVQMSWSKWRLG